ncbi:MAG: gliding motility-associated C-terminal domain-containing protein, partial [Spirochaetales bacterium]|nr:gliding motility-associated C-terminal domain-containing protein [Spirochaetales bacterium]
MKLSRTIFIGLVLLILLSATFPVFAGGNKEIPEVPPLTSGTQYISPDSNGVQDNAELSFSVKVYVKSDEGYVPEYGIQILDQAGSVMKEIVQTEKSDIGWFLSIFRGYSEFTLERTISWDGTDKTGSVVPDGVYGVKLWVVDSSKNRKDIDVDSFVVDTQKPEAILVAPESLIFSPNGDNSLDSIDIANTRSTEEVLWEGIILDESGKTIRNYSWQNGIPGTAVWDGLDDEGAPASPGTYSYSLSSTDKAGNESDPIILEGIILDLRATPIAVLIDTPVISPDGNGIQDFMTVYLDLAVTEGIVSWEWQIRDSLETVYWQVTGDSNIPQEVVFDGTDSDGKPVPEGVYSFIYKVQYENGNKPTALEPFTVDVTAPEISVSVNNNIFSPNGDGLKDQVKIRFKSNEQVSWKGSVIDSLGEELISTSSNLTTSLIVWDGKKADGEDVPDGNYSVIARFTDSAGNSSSIDPASLIIDRTPVDIALKTGKGFSPDSDGVSDDLIILVDSSQYNYLESWKL